MKPDQSALAPITPRSVVLGLLFSLLLCAMNSYLTLSFGVIEEGPTIAALFFFALMLPFGAKSITTTEMVVVATMGSAGGSLGFISNFYAAKTLTGDPYSVLDMAMFGIVSSLIGLVMAIPLRQLLVLKENLPWPGSRAVETVIRTLVEKGDPRQALVLVGVFLVLTFYVVFNTEDGYGWFPAELVFPGLATVGGAIALSPFAIGGSYLMGMRTCVGFLAGACLLMYCKQWMPLGPDESPHRYYWPGLGFLVASGLTGMVLNWRTITASFRSMLAIGGKTDDPDPVMSGKALAGFAVVSFVACAAVLNLRFAVNMFLVVVLVLVAGLIQNIIATRAAAQTAFNPARVMGILLQGVTAALGGKSPAINLTGAGFVAGSGAQASLLTADMVYGRAFKVPSRWQFWTQLITVVPCSFAAAYMFDWIRTTKSIAEMPAPIAKMWAESAKVFDQGFHALPSGAGTALLIGAGVGIVYTLVELIPAVRKWIPESIGLGLGLVLAPAYGIAFFVGGFLLWIVLGRWAKWSDATLTTIAVASIVAEGIGGVLKPVLAMAGLMGHP
ncbi:MAG: OPT/YSL family transporter [Planctomycetes bacterium]|nr:OPT/YSL family transporter [Planctomycetota bacterium]